MEKILSLCPIFRDLAPEEIRGLLEKTPHTRRSFEKNEILYRPGDPAHHIAVILAGTIEIRKFLASGNKLSIFQRAAGEVLGGSIVFSSDPRYPCEVAAREKSELLFIEKAYFLDILFKNSIVASNVLRISADRIMQFEKRLELFSFYSIRKKIAFSLLNDFPREADTVTIPFSKTTWSEYLNVSRTSLSRELKVLCDQGILQMEGSSVRLVEKEMLASLLWET